MPNFWLFIVSKRNKTNVSTLQMTRKDVRASCSEMTNLHPHYFIQPGAYKSSSGDEIPEPDLI